MWRTVGPIFLMGLALVASALAEDPRERDPLFRALKRLVDDQGDCFMKESQVISRSKADLETAAYAVLARCGEQTERYKAFAKRNDIRNPAQFEEYWATREARDLQHVKKLIAFHRTR